MTIHLIDSVSQGVEPIFSLIVKKHYMQKIDYSRTTPRAKLSRKQFRNRINRLQIGSLFYTRSNEAGKWQAAIVLEKRLGGIKAYCQVTQKYCLFGVGDSTSFLLEDEYNRMFNEVSTIDRSVDKNIDKIMNL